MFSTTSLLVLACACAVTVNAQDPNQCIRVQIGTVSLNKVTFDPVLIAYKQTDVQIPYPAQCVNGESGVVAEVCDNGLVLPTAYFKDVSKLMVQRNGALDGYATVIVTVFCN